MQSNSGRNRLLVGILAVGAVGNIAAAKVASGRAYTIPPPTPLPLSLIGYKGQPIPTLDSTKSILPHADISSVHYEKEANPVDLVVIASRDPNDMHSPERCFSGFGYEIKEQSAFPLEIGGANPGKWDVQRMRVKDASGEQLVLFLYDKVASVGGGTNLTRILMKLRPSKDPAYFVRLSGPISGTDVDGEQKRLVEFATELMQNRSNWQKSSQVASK